MLDAVLAEMVACVLSEPRGDGGPCVDIGKTVSSWDVYCCRVMLDSASAGAEEDPVELSVTTTPERVLSETVTLLCWLLEPDATVVVDRGRGGGVWSDSLACVLVLAEVFVCPLTLRWVMEATGEACSAKCEDLLRSQNSPLCDEDQVVSYLVSAS